MDAAPGFYSNRPTPDFRTFNIPFVIGGSYIVNRDILWMLGLSVDLNRRYPVLPGAGLRWRFAEQWTLNALFPAPRLEYAPAKTLTLYAGAELKGGSYRVDNQFGTANGDRRLNNAIVSYTEIRTGIGAAWKVSRNFAVELEGGYMPHREFDYHRAGLEVETHRGAPYCQVAISGQF